MSIELLAIIELSVFILPFLLGREIITGLTFHGHVKGGGGGWS